MWTPTVRVGYGKSDSESDSERVSDSESGRGSATICDLRLEWCRVVSHCDATLMRKGRFSWQLGSGSLMWTSMVRAEREGYGRR